jgi:hypothetical protein
MVLKVNSNDVKQIDVNIPNVTTITTVDAAIDVPGVKTGEVYLVAFDLAALDAGLLYGTMVHATAPDVLTVRFVNPTAGDINPAAGIEMTYMKL